MRNWRTIKDTKGSMSVLGIVMLAVLLGLSIIPGHGYAAMFLRTDPEIRGESTTSGYEGWIEVNACSFGIRREIKWSEGRVDREVAPPVFDEIRIVKRIDIASPEIYQACLTASKFGEAVIHFVDPATSIKFLELRLRDPIISSVSVNDPQNETVTLNYTHVIWKHTQIGPDGRALESGPVGWDIVRGVPAR